MYVCALVELSYQVYPKRAVPRHLDKCLHTCMISIRAKSKASKIPSTVPSYLRTKQGAEVNYTTARESPRFARNILLLDTVLCAHHHVWCIANVSMIFECLNHLLHFDTDSLGLDVFDRKRNLGKVSNAKASRLYPSTR